MKVNLKEANKNLSQVNSTGQSNKRQKTQHKPSVNHNDNGHLVNGNDDNDDAEISDLITSSQAKSISQSNPTLDALLSSPIGSKWVPGTHFGNFVQEIKMMMYTFGDYHEPLTESAQLIEEIVYQQMTLLLHLACEVAVERDAKLIGLEDVIFLMRRDKSKLARLIKALKVSDSKNEAKGWLKQGLEDDDIETTVCSIDEMTNETQEKLQTKRVKLCYDFISSIDSTGSLLEIFNDDYFDSVKHERNLKFEKIANELNASQYLKYCEARKVSFSSLRNNKFKDWLFRDFNHELKPHQYFIEVMQRLAYETVGQIVEMALMIKQDYQRDPCDPLTCLLPNKMINNDYPMYQGSSNKTNKITNQMTDSLNLHGLIPSSSNSFGKISISSLKRNESKAFNPTEYCISPNHIREALRRYLTVPSIFSKRTSFNQSLNSKLICI